MKNIIAVLCTTISTTPRTHAQEAQTKFATKPTSKFRIMGGLAFIISTVAPGLGYSYGLRKTGRSGLSGNLTNNLKNSAIFFYVGFGF